MSRAKQMFWQYNCNLWHIAHDGADKDYIGLGGGDAHEESVWRAEFIEDCLTRLRAGDLESLFQLECADAVEAIGELVALQDFEDDYSRFEVARSLQELAGYESSITDRTRAALVRAKELWRDIVSSPLGVTDANRAKIDDHMLKAFGAIDAEGYLRNFSEAKLFGRHSGEYRKPWWKFW